MLFANWREWVNETFGASKKTHRRPIRSHRFRPELLRLEDRLTPANITPTTFSDFAVTGGVSATGVITGGAGDGLITLRSAVIAANAADASGGTSTITLNAGTYQLTIVGNAAPGANPNDENAAIGDLDVFHSGLTINGAGPGSTIIKQTTSNDRVFNVDENFNETPFNFTIKNLTIEGGRDTTLGGGGGAIFSGAVDTGLTDVENVQFLNNQATGSGTFGGGAILLLGASLTVNNSTFGDGTSGNANTTTGEGGAIAYDSFGTTGTFTVTNSTFDKNLANGSSGSAGGAIDIVGSNGGTTTAIISGSSFENNSSTLFNGGAIAVDSTGVGVGSVSVTTSTFDSNTAASGHGGAIRSDGHTTSVSFSRFFNNTASAGSGQTLQVGADATSFTANDNWWGMNSGPGANDLGKDSATPTITATDWLQLRISPSTSTIATNATQTLSADILGLHSGGATSASNLTGLPAFPSPATTIFSNPVLGTLTTDPTTQFVNGVAAANAVFTAGTTAGTGHASVTADNQTVTANITITVVGPTTSSLTVTPSPTNMPPNISASVSDVSSGNNNVMAAEYFIDATGANGSGTALTGAFTSPTVSVSGTLTAAQFNSLSQGTHTIYVHGEDALGNWGTTVSTTFVKDTVGPTTSSLSVTPSPTNTPPNINASVSDASSGNSNVIAAEYFIDATGANGSGTALTGAFTSPTVSVSGTLTATQFNSLSEGTHTIYVHGEDALGNWGTTVSTTFVKDTVGPTTSSLSVTPSPTNTPPNISASVSDASSGNSNVIAAEYFIDATGANGSGTALTGAFTSPTVSVSGTLTAAQFNSLSEGTHTIYVHGEDALGNWGTTVSTSFVKDTVGPTTSSLSVTPSPTNTPPNINASVSDASSGNSNVIAAEYFIDATGANGSGTALTGAFTSPTVSVSGTLTATQFNSLSEGTHTIYVHGEDALGNWGTTVSTTFVKDTVGPTTSSLSVTPSPTNTPPNIGASVSDASSGNSNVIAAEYFIDATGANGSGTALTGAFTSPTVSVSGTLTAAQFNSLSEGTHTIYVHGEDALGNWGTTVSTSFVKDTVGPTTSSLSVTPSPTNTPPNISASVSDASSGNSNVIAAEYFIDATGANGSGTALTGAFTSPTVSVSGTLTAAQFNSLSLGTHTIYVHGEDALGNWGTTVSTNFVVVGPPSISAMFGAAHGCAERHDQPELHDHQSEPGDGAERGWIHRHVARRAGGGHSQRLEQSHPRRWHSHGHGWIEHHHFDRRHGARQWEHHV